MYLNPAMLTAPLIGSTVMALVTLRLVVSGARYWRMATFIVAWQILTPLSESILDPLMMAVLYLVAEVAFMVGMKAMRPAKSPESVENSGDH